MILTKSKVNFDIDQLGQNTFVKRFVLKIMANKILYKLSVPNPDFNTKYIVQSPIALLLLTEERDNTFLTKVNINADF